MLNRLAGFVLGVAAAATLGASETVAAAAGTTAAAQTQATVYPSFRDFVRSLSSARSESYLGKQPGAVQDASAFEQMRNHLLKLYSGVAVPHTFDLEGEVFDCIPLMQQPAVRLLGLKTIATQPPPMGSNVERTMQVAPGTRDAFGSLRACARGTIPMRRLTLDALSRFRTLRAFFQKSPGGRDSVHPGNANGHSYATGTQFVKNRGANGVLNIWNTAVDLKAGQSFNLSQNWTVGGKGNSTQTVESGWQNYPLHYGVRKTVLFIYFTADNYQNTGCYNLECGKFVQVDNSWFLGGIIGDYSVSGGYQSSIGLGYQLQQGNWWLYINGVAIGYYPASLYKRGPLATHADEIQYGGEVCCSDGKTWPAMGSGAFAEAAYSLAAWQDGLYYVDPEGYGGYPTLTPYTPSPACYTFFETDNIYRTSFYFGGPGGKRAKC
jgi:hypothetical protein